MRFNRTQTAIQEGDLTPMIDMTFQLIAFFMVLINFSQSEQVEKVQLPESELAKPPDTAFEFPVTLHLTADATVIIGGQEISIAQLGPFLVREKTVLQSRGRPISDATVIIRAHKDAQTGKVQELIQKCQEASFEKFVLRAKEYVGD